MSLVIADYSEYQGEVWPPAGQVVIIRAHNGYRPDEFFAANRTNAVRAGAPAIGLYQYLPAGSNPASVALDLVRTIGVLAPNEWLICDLEEGPGDQQGRWQAWRQEILLLSGREPWLYSDLAFAQAHDLDPDWVAAYAPNEPRIPHKLWQNTDAYPWPWGRSDASVYDGSLPQFLSATGVTVQTIRPALTSTARGGYAPAQTNRPVIPAKEKPVFIIDALDTKTQFLVFDNGKVAQLHSAKIGSGLTASPGPAGAGLPYLEGLQADVDSIAKGYQPA